MRQASKVCAKLLTGEDDGTQGRLAASAAAFTAGCAASRYNVGRTATSA